jgi:hypothetical protein
LAISDPLSAKDFRRDGWKEWRRTCLKLWLTADN